MFEYIGRKIKSFAKLMFWAGIVFHAIIGIIAAEAADSFWVFLLAAVAGFVISYLSVIVLYMFGQLVDNSDIVAENSERQVKLLKEIKAAFFESCTGLSTKANRQANLLEEIQSELAHCHAADAAEETPIEEVPVEETPAEETPAEPETAPEVGETPSPAPIPTVACKKCGFVLVNEVRDLSDSVFCPGCGLKQHD